MRNNSRLQKLEEKISPNELSVIGISSLLDDRVPVGHYGKIVNGELSIYSKEEHQDEIRDCSNLITVGA